LYWNTGTQSTTQLANTAERLRKIFEQISTSRSNGSHYLRPVRMSAFALDLGLNSLYNVCMKISMGCVKIVCVIGLTGLLMGCAAVTVTNMAAWITTGKSVTDHSASTLTRSNCDSVRAVKELTYWCETTPDIDVRYNRSGI